MGILIALALWFAGSDTRMTTFTIQPGSTGADIYINASSPTTNFFTDTRCFVGITQIGDNYRSLFRLDLSSLPDGATADSASLVVQGVQSGTPYPIYIAPVTQTAWTRDGATWNRYDGTNNWLAALGGGDYTLAGAAVFTGATGANTIDGEDFLALVQAAIDGSGYLDLEFISAAGQPDDSLWYFKSSRDTTAANRPLLTIMYRVNERSLESSYSPVITNFQETLIESIPFDLTPTSVVLAHKEF